MLLFVNRLYLYTYKHSFSQIVIHFNFWKVLLLTTSKNTVLSVFKVIHLGRKENRGENRNEGNARKTRYKIQYRYHCKSRILWSMLLNVYQEILQFYFPIKSMRWHPLKFILKTAFTFLSLISKVNSYRGGFLVSSSLWTTPESDVNAFFSNRDLTPTT